MYERRDTHLCMASLAFVGYWHMDSNQCWEMACEMEWENGMGNGVGYVRASRHMKC